ncbi:carbohydrate esterase family 8 protein [Xylariaceae sp. FL0594]|nr:carbohydrate esterase family 8 protein [Xylariaceae sp. FL0594]
MRLGLKDLLVALVLSSSQATATARKPHPAQTFRECQSRTHNPLQRCPPGTIYVSQTDPRADFHKIQDAVASIGNDSLPHVILIAPGVYVEQLNVTRRTPLTLLGVSDRPKRGELYAVGPENENDVQIYWNSANHDAVFPDNVYTGVLTVGPNLNATLTGTGPTGFPVPGDTPFGCVDFRAYNIDFRNEYAPYASGPAHAVGVYVGKRGNVYFRDVIVAGQTDFLYGFGTLYISASTLSLRNCGGGITAWKGTNASTSSPSLPSPAPPSGNKYGVYVSHSRVMASNHTIAPIIRGKCSLGRPWNDLHHSVFMRTYLDASILPAGYTPWAGKPDNVGMGAGIGPDTVMAVYDVCGPGYDEDAERAAANVTMVFNKQQARPYLEPVDVFVTAEDGRPDVSWIDPSALPS